MAAQEYQYIDDILKEFYSPVLVSQAYKKAPFWAQVQKIPVKTMAGRRLVLPVQTAFTEAVGSRIANNYNLPSAGRNLYDTAYLYMKRIYGRVQVDGFSIAATKGSGSWIDVLTNEMKGVINAFGLELDRMTMGRGNGILAYTNGTGSSATVVTVDTPGGISGDTPNTKWLRKGMVVDIYTSGGSQEVNSVQISSVDSSNSQFTLASSSNWSDNSYVVKEDSWSSTAANIGDLMGIDGIVDSGNTPGSDFQGISRSSETTWQAYETSTATVISETAIQEVLDEIEKVSAGDAPNFGLTTYSLRNKLVDLIRGDRQIDTMDLKGGWKAIRYVGGNVEIPLMVHKYCPSGYFYFISLPHIKFYSLKKLVWDNKGGGVVKPVADADKYEAWFKMYANMGTDCSSAHGKHTNFSTS